MKKKTIQLTLASAVSIFLIAAAGTGIFGARSSEMLSFIPPILAAALMLISKKALPALAAGAFSGALILSLAGRSDVTAAFSGLSLLADRMIAVASKPSNAGILIQCFLIMGLMSVISCAGGFRALSDFVLSHAKTRRSTELAACFAGIILFFDPYAGIMASGALMRPIADRMRVSREKLAFLIHSTSVPLSGVSMVSTWLASELGAVRIGLDLAGAQDIPAYGFLFTTVPFRFYNLFMLLTVLISASTLRDFGLMYKAEYRARTSVSGTPDQESGALPEQSPVGVGKKAGLSALYAAVPLSVLILSIAAGAFISGYRTIMAGVDKELIAVLSRSVFSWPAIRACLSYAEISPVLVKSGLISTLIAFLMILIGKKLSFTELMRTWTAGASSASSPVFLLLFAWTMASFTEELGIGGVLAGAAHAWIPRFAFPAFVFLLSALISFASGSFHGAISILLPIVIPMSWQLMSEEVFFTASTAAVLSGAVFGIHCSPFADTSILSSASAACDHAEHIKTQLPYVLLIAGISVLFGYIPIGVGFTLRIALIIGAFATYAVFDVLCKNPDRERAKELLKARGGKVSAAPDVENADSGTFCP